MTPLAAVHDRTTDERPAPLHGVMDEEVPMNLRARTRRTRRAAATAALIVITVLTGGLTAAPPAAAVRGGTAPSGSHPWVVLLTRAISPTRVKVCTGSLVSPSHVLTAAHCVVDGRRTAEPATLALRIGATSDGDGEVRSARAIAVHPGYERSGDPEFAYDVAVVTLTSPSTRAPIDLASPEAPSDAAAAVAGTRAVVLGFGITGEGRADSQVLRTARLRIWSGREGEAFFEGLEYLFDDRFSRTLHLAAGGDGDAAICNGDSGGPLFVHTATGPKLIGVTSWSDAQIFEAACDPDEPGVFTRVNGPEVHAWVEAHIRETPLVGDFDGDGRDDILTLTHGQRADAYVALSRGTGFAPSRLWHGWTSHDGTHARVGDVDGDGRDDLWVFDASFTRVWVQRSLGDRFADAWSQSVPEYGAAVLVDVDGDGRDDLVRVGTRVAWYRSSGTSLALAWASPLGAQVRGTYGAGDVDRDGDEDLVVFDQGLRGNDVWVLRSTGTAFGPAERWHDHFALAGEQPHVGRFGWATLADVVTFVPGHDDVWVGVNISGYYESERWHTDFGTRAASTRMIGDFDGDGLDDLVEFVQDAGGDVLVALRDPGRAGFGPTTLWHPYFAVGDVARW